MKKHFSAGGILLNHKNEIFLIHQTERNEWTLPKGGILEGETKVEAANREIREETGYKNIEVVDKKPLFVHNYSFTHPVTKEKIEKTVTFFLFKLLNNQSSNTEEMIEEKLSGTWFSYKDALKKVSFEELKTVIKNAKERELAQKSRKI